MNIHKNARLTPPGRLLLVQRIEGGGWGLAAAAIAAGISERQSYRWLGRYRSGGAAALADRSSAPQCCKHRIGTERVDEIERLRRQRMSGPAIARQLSMPVSTVGAILRRLGLGKLAALAPKQVVIRYERERPYARPYATSQERRAALAPWLDHYNTERPHAALAHHPPVARLHQSQLLCSIEGAVASSRPNSNQDCGGPPLQSRSFKEGPLPDLLNNVLGNDS